MSTTIPDDSLNHPGPSKLPSPPICALCNSQPSKYTCPRCQTKTCSLPCSRTHKTTTGCSGERDRTAYVPMNQYGYAALVNDYVFLEDVGRKVEGWGREIVKQGIDLRGSSTRTGRGRGRGAKRMSRHGTDKKSTLAIQLSVRDVDMDILPMGMKRANSNRSSWDFKRKRALLTIELVFHPPPDPLTRKELGPISIITHKKDWDQSIRQIIQTSTSETTSTKNRKELINWLNLEEDDETIPSGVLCLMARPRSYDDTLILNPSRPAYYKFDWTEKLSKALRQKHFVEFPTLLLVDENSFDGVLIDDSGVAEDTHERRSKRRKLDSKEAKKAIASLVGGYGSDEEEQPSVLDKLADYSGSEPDEDVLQLDEDEDGIDDEEKDDSEDVLDAGQVANNLVFMDEEEDELDWGDDEIAEDEARLAQLSATIQQRYPLQ